MAIKTLLVVLCLASIAFAVKQVRVVNRKLVDPLGRQIRIHGPNVVVKVPPYHPITDRYDSEWSFSLEDIHNCTKWGFNGVRLGMMWAGVEPTKDTYNETYLDIMEQLINRAGENGVYTLIDYHQDIMSQKFCGDGIPVWLADQLKLYKTFPFPMGKKIALNESGLPGWDKCDTQGWGKYYFSYDVGNAFAELYRQGSHLNKKFTQFWQKVASRFKGNPYVIGYELINEPFVGNAIRNLGLVIPSNAERAKFQQFYDNLATEIRKIDSETLIFFEPITFDNMIPAGFSHPPGGKRFANSSVLAYHYYTPPALGPGTLTSRVLDGKRLGVVSFLSEFGTSDSEVMEFTQKHQQSWLYWIYKSYGKNWGSFGQSVLEEPRDKVFKENGINENRTFTYMQRISGELLDENFNFKTKHYVGHYKAKPNGKSVLYYNTHFNYPNGHELEITPSSKCSTILVREGYYEIIFNGDQQSIVQISLTAL